MMTLELLWKATVILAATFAVCAALRQSTAALRHFVWAAAFAALLLLPVALRTTPKWEAPVAAQPVRSLPPPAVTRVAAAPAGPAISLSALWWIGFLLVAGRFLAGAARTAWIVRHGRELECRELERCGRVRIVASAAAPMPMTWGILRPVVVLPKEAAEWPAERTEVVLTHELTHVGRRDLLAQAIAQAACSLYWFHPLAWLGLRELRKEREHACDDGVLRTGIPAHEYASHLVELARSMAARRGSLADAPAMADTSGLESRIRMLLDRGRNRSPLRPLAAVSIAAAALAALMPLASFTALAQGANGTVAGIVQDPSGARVPAVTVTARNLDGPFQEDTTTNATGEYLFRSIPAGRYAITAGVPGFKRWTKEITLVAGATAQADAWLQVGNISEAVRVVGRPGPAGSIAPTAAAPKAIRIGGYVRQARLIQHTRPAYPEELKQQGIEGIVGIVAVIAKDGSLKNPQVIKGDTRLARAALDAVSQWSYEPALLNGEPIEVVTNIDVQFQLGQ